MRIVKVQDLQANLNEALAAVQAGEIIEITDEGRSIARLIPANSRASTEEIEQAIAEVNRLAEEIGRHMPEGVTVERIIEDIRS